MTLYTIKDTTIGSMNLFVTNFSNQSYTTKGIFDIDFYCIDRSAIRNNLSEKESINLIDKIRDKLPMNQ